MIKLLRIKYSNETHRNRQRLIGAFRVDEGVPLALIEMLDWGERRALDRWLAAYQETQARARACVVMANAPQQLEALIAALDLAADTLSPVEADRVWQQLQAIARILRRAGHPLPRVERRPGPPPPGAERPECPPLGLDRNDLSPGQTEPPGVPFFATSSARLVAPGARQLANFSAGSRNEETASLRAHRAAIGTMGATDCRGSVGNF
ncbi:hypothetical protein [Burkholderia ubonensis]|uniref:hypothetical protein n=1 Tax=Burkholderia ubonensis TaxID=101571 RepID=UPI000A830EC2|nr:hypothetical protein [Burkholderia ubonensis]